MSNTLNANQHISADTNNAETAHTNGADAAPALRGFGGFGGDSGADTHADGAASQDADEPSQVTLTAPSRYVCEVLCPTLPPRVRHTLGQQDKYVATDDLVALGLITEAQRPTVGDVHDWSQRTLHKPYDFYAKSVPLDALRGIITGYDSRREIALATLMPLGDAAVPWAVAAVNWLRDSNTVARREPVLAVAVAELMRAGASEADVAALPTADLRTKAASVRLIETWAEAERLERRRKAARGGAPEPDEDGPLYADIDALLSDGLPPAPTPDILRRTDGVGLFYRSEINLLYGDPEDGKTMLALAGCAQVLSDGGVAMFIDLDDNGVASTVARLLMLGAPVEALRAGRFRYCSPAGRDRMEEAVKDCLGQGRSPDIVVIDCVGELVPLYDGSNNDSDDFTRIIRATAGPLSRAGSAVVLIDHMAKNTDSRNYGAGGTMAKRRRVGGTQLRVVVQKPLRKGQGGALRVLIRKDRHSGLRQHCHTAPDVKGALQEAGTFVIEPGDAAWCVAVDPMTFSAPLERGGKHGQYVEAARLLDDGWTITELTKHVHGEKFTAAQRKDTDRAVKDLVADNGRVELLAPGAKFKPATHRLVGDLAPTVEADSETDE